MIQYAPNADCSCGSSKPAKFCCIPEELPTMQKPNAWENLRLSMRGIDDTGNVVDVYFPPEVSLHAELRQPHQLDEKVEETGSIIKEIVAGYVEESNKEMFGRRYQNLEEALYAVRYHQRQFLFRMRMVYVQHRPKQMEGSGNINLDFVDFPLKFELEAFIVRCKSCLDATAQLLTLCIEGKSKTFGSFYTDVIKKQKPSRKLSIKFKHIFEQHDGWLGDIKDYRDDIVHHSSFVDLSGVEYTVHSVDRPKVGEEYADEFCISVWKSLPVMLVELFRVIKKKR